MEKTDMPGSHGRSASSCCKSIVMCKRSEGWMHARRVLWRAELSWGYAISKRLMTSHKGLKIT